MIIHKACWSYPYLIHTSAQWRPLLKSKNHLTSNARNQLVVYQYHVYHKSIYYLVTAILLLENPSAPYIRPKQLTELLNLCWLEHSSDHECRIKVLEHLFLDSFDVDLSASFYKFKDNNEWPNSRLALRGTLAIYIRHGGRRKVIWPLEQRINCRDLRIKCPNSGHFDVRHS